MIPYNYIGGYLGELQANGRCAFSLAEVHAKFPKSDEAIKKALQRLKDKKEIAPVRKGFYVIIPPEFKSRGMLPPAMFIDELMKFLGRDYYVSLLSAAEFYGSAYEQSPVFSVVTTKPSLRTIQTINFNIKKGWSKDDIDDVKVERGHVNVSSPELTALDLLLYLDKAAGIDRITSAVEDLCDSMDAEKLLATAKRFPAIAAIQRLGFLLDEVLQLQGLSDPLAEYLNTVNYFPVLLEPEKDRPLRMVTGNKWKVVVPSIPHV